MVRLPLDIASAETWVNPECSAFPENAAEYCISNGIYRPRKSSTSKMLVDFVHPHTTVDYDRGAVTTFKYVKDKVEIFSNIIRSMIVLENFQFGVASTTSNMFAGALGLGYGKATGLNHDNFPDALFASNQTPAKIFQHDPWERREEERCEVSDLWGARQAKVFWSAHFDPCIFPLRVWINIAST